MNVKKFVAPTARDALHKVKEILGPDAIILSNRGLPGGGVEIMAVAQREMAALAPSPVPLKDVAPRISTPNTQPAPANRSADDDYTVSLTSQRVSAAVPKAFVPPPARADAETPRSRPAATSLASRPMPRIEEPAAPVARTEAEVVPAAATDIDEESEE